MGWLPTKSRKQHRAVQRGVGTNEKGERQGDLRCGRICWGEFGGGCGIDETDGAEGAVFEVSGGCR